MINGHKIIVVMPAYNAEKTLVETCQEVPLDVVDEVILVDDSSSDKTVEVAGELGIHVVIHPENKGYGQNQKTCYQEALKHNADIVVMLHPDYQYSPALIPDMCKLISSGQSDVVLGSRVLGGGALKGGMPVYKYIANRVLTFIQNTFLGTNLSEFHTGYRAYSSDVLKSINYQQNSNDFVFDNQLISQIIYKGFRVAEIPCPTKYFPEASSIGFLRSVVYGAGCLIVSFLFRFNKMGIIRSKLYHG